jgi:hypothetical protein
MRRRKLDAEETTAPEWVRATTGPEAHGPGEGRCERYWRPREPMAPTRTMSDRSLPFISHPAGWGAHEAESRFRRNTIPRRRGSPGP